MSRSSRPSLFGKRTVQKRIRVAPATAEAIARKWRELGFDNEADYMAYVQEIAAHGFEHVRMLQEERLKKIAGIEAEIGRKMPSS